MKKKRVKKTFYEWKLELIDKYDDIVDNDFADNLDGFMWRQFIEGPQAGPVKEGDNIVRYDLCLTRRYYDEEDPEADDTSFAYIKNGKLPEFFDGGNKVPTRCHREIEKLTKKGADQ